MRHCPGGMTGLAANNACMPSVLTAWFIFPHDISFSKKANMSDNNPQNELKVPVLDPQPSSEQQKKEQDFDPELPPVIKMLHESAASPSSKLLLVALKAGGYLCAIPPILSLLGFLGHFSLWTLFAFISCTIGFAALGLTLFSLEKILKAIMAAHEDEQ